MSGNNADAPNVKIIPPLVYLTGIVIGFLGSIWMPTKVVPNLLAWTVGGILVFCGAVLTGSAVLKFKDAGTTVRPDRAASTLVIAGPYKITRNPMYLGLAFVYAGIAIAGQSGADPFGGCIDYCTAWGNRARGGISGKAFWRRLSQLQGKGQALDITAAIGRWSYPSLVTC
jgi:protein-S-isoprenylcysteine O-methyltransferase Ste14